MRDHVVFSTILWRIHHNAFLLRLSSHLHGVWHYKWGEKEHKKLDFFL
jgi:hypothetical protein